MLTVPDQWKVAASSVCETKMGVEGIDIHLYFFIFYHFYQTATSNCQVLFYV